MPHAFHGFFDGPHEARRHMNAPLWTTPLGSNDPYFPHTLEQEKYLVKEIYEAMIDPGPFWRGIPMSYRQCGILKEPDVLSHQTSDKLLEAIAWEALQAMKKLYREGFTSSYDHTNRVSPDRHFSFIDRHKALCSLLKDWKCACDMMIRWQSYKFVALPVFYRKAFEQLASRELQRAQEMASHDASLTKALADLVRHISKCGLFEFPVARANIWPFYATIVLIDTFGFEQFLNKQHGSSGKSIESSDDRMVELLPPSKKRRIGEPIAGYPSRMHRQSCRRKSSREQQELSRHHPTGHGARHL
ncbi:uncharacterized protein J3D65DRAFT_321129 [Phyllosticta citribraziliensis]|uniref:Uncharacterized protein n=1 Tax=Phyllosticta citribraziliensis TaxID=989973 RepID=A0ABR1LSS1_9PEZI